MLVVVPPKRYLLLFYESKMKLLFLLCEGLTCWYQEILLACLV